MFCQIYSTTVFIRCSGRWTETRVNMAQHILRECIAVSVNLCVFQSIFGGSIERTDTNRLFLPVSRRTSAWLQSLHPGNHSGQTQDSHPKSARSEWMCVFVLESCRPLPLFAPNVLKISNMTGYVIAFFQTISLHRPGDLSFAIMLL